MQLSRRLIASESSGLASKLGKASQSSHNASSAQYGSSRPWLQKRRVDRFATQVSSSESSLKDPYHGSVMHRGSNSRHGVSASPVRASHESMPKDDRASISQDTGAISPGPSEHQIHNAENYLGEAKDSPSRLPRTVEVMLNNIEDMSTPSIYKKIRAGKARSSDALAAYLVRYRNETPNIKLYSGLLKAQCHSQSGSAHQIAMILDEMRDEGVELTAEAYHIALKALAIHPHHMLREQILEPMRSAWVQLSDDSRHDLVAAHLRADEYETALILLGEMVDVGVAIQGWLLDLAMYSLLEAGERIEVMRLTRLRTERLGQAMTGSLWYRMLDDASRAFDFTFVSYIWNQRVVPGYLNPSSGQSINVLKTAARAGDITLATDVFRILAQRNFIFQAHHYELLCETYITAQDVPNALKILCIMAGLGLNIEQSSTRKLFRRLTGNNSVDLREQARTALSELKATHLVPPAALNVLIETEATYDLHEATDLYKAFGQICTASPTLETFNMLIKACVHHRDKDTAMFVASEMVKYNIEPDALAYDRLVLICTLTDTLDDASKYLFEMRQQGFTPRLGTLFGLAKAAAIKADPRTLDLVRVMSATRDGEQPAALVQRLYDQAVAASNEPGGGHGLTNETIKLYG